MNLKEFKQINLKGGDRKIMKTKIKQEKGITLIALVITIVVLLILAGVSINAIFSENGIINKAKDAQNKMDQAQNSDWDAINSLNDTMSEVSGEKEAEKRKLLDIVERYILGEDKKGILATTIVDISNAPTSFKFIGNEIIPDAETAIEFKTFEQDGNNIKILFEYKNNYYTATADTTTYMTKTVEIKEYYYSKKIFEGSLTLTDSSLPLTGTTDELSYSKQYKVVYTIDGQEKSGITITGQYDKLFGTMAMSIDNKFCISVFGKDDYRIFKTTTEAGKEVIIKQIYEIGESENCVEENGFMALFYERRMGHNKYTKRRLYGSNNSKRQKNNCGIFRLYVWKRNIYSIV